MYFKNYFQDLELKKQKNYNNQIVQKTSKYQKIYGFKVGHQKEHETYSSLVLAT